MNSTYTLQRSSRAPGEHFDICVGCGVFQPLLATWVFFLSGVIFPLALVQVTPDPHHRLWMVAFGICTASAARLAWIIGEGRRRLSELIYWVFVYAFLGLAPLVQIREGYWPGTTPRTDWSLVSTALLVVVVGCVAFGVGIFTTEIAMRTNLKIRAFVMASRVSRLPDPRLLCGFAIFSLILNAYFLSQTRVLQFTQSRYNLIELEELETSASFESIVEAAAGMSLLVAFVALVRERRVRSRLSRYLDVARQSNFRLFLTILVGIALLNTMNPISNARYLAGTAILGAAAALGMVRTKRRFRIFAIAFVACIVFIFPFLDAFRYSLQGELKSSGVVASLSSADFDSFAQIDNSVLYVDREGTAQGRQAMGVLAFWIPRHAWPQKPQDTGIVLAVDRNYEFRNLSAPLWSEFYINGGWLLLAVGMFIVGIVVAIADSRIEVQLLTQGSIGVLGCILPFYFMMLLRGSLLQAMSYLALVVVFTLLLSIGSRASKEIPVRSAQ